MTVLCHSSSEHCCHHTSLSMTHFQSVNGSSSSIDPFLGNVSYNSGVNANLLWALYSLTAFNLAQSNVFWMSFTSNNSYNLWVNMHSLNESSRVIISNWQSEVWKVKCGSIIVCRHLAHFVMSLHWPNIIGGWEIDQASIQQPLSFSAF